VSFSFFSVAPFTLPLFDPNQQRKQKDSFMLDFSSESKLVAAVLLLYAALGAIALSLIRSSPRHGGNVFLGSGKKD
jgi:hypothetical protein